MGCLLLVRIVCLVISIGIGYTNNTTCLFSVFILLSFSHFLLSAVHRLSDLARYTFKSAPIVSTVLCACAFRVGLFAFSENYHGNQGFILLGGAHNPHIHEQIYAYTEFD